MHVPQFSSARYARRAFTLIELVIVIAILAILTGAAVPMASKFLESKARAATRAELEQLSAAALEYFRDTGSLPTSVEALLSGASASGWAGPYLSVQSSEPWSGANDVQVDAWALAYRFQILAASRLEIASAGPDRSFGDETDIVFSVDVTPVRREKTRAQLATLNTAIRSYNAEYLPDDPLSTKYATLLTRLVSTGFLPAAAGFQVDAWGSAFVPDPAGKSPVVAVASPNLEAAGVGGDATSGGQAKGGKKGKNGKNDTGSGQGGSGNNGKGKGKKG